MSVQTLSPDHPARATSSRGRRDRIDHLLLFGAPVAAIVAGVAAEWLDFRALRYPLLLLVLAGVLATSYALECGDAARRSGITLIGRALLIGVLTWAAAETLYVVIHTARGEPFEVERFGPQWAQALGLISVHAMVLGAPTGAVAGGVLALRRRFFADEAP